MITARLVHAAALALACVLGSGGSVWAAGCPSEEEAQASIIRHINTFDWSPGQREIWKIKSVGEFKFSSMRIGRMMGSVCPIRLQYSYVVVKNDGTRSVTEGGPDKTYNFSQNEFDEWVYTVG